MATIFLENLSGTCSTAEWMGSKANNQQRINQYGQNVQHDSPKLLQLTITGMLLP